MFVAILLAAAGALTPAQPEDGAGAALVIEAPVSEVTVWSGEAQVVRTIDLALSGRRRVALPLLPASVRVDSVRLEPVTGGRVDSVEVRALTAEPLPEAEVRALVTAIAAAAERLQEAEREVEALRAFEAVGTLAPEAPADAAGGKLVPAAWREALRFTRAEGEALAARRRQAQGRCDERKADLAALKARAGALRARVAGGQVAIEATLTGQGPARFRLSYLVDGAIWRPRYELRRASGRDEVEVRLLGEVEQTTGEDWRQARLTLSTARPLLPPPQPRLPAWRIGTSEDFTPRPRAFAQEPVARAAPPPASPSAQARLRAALEAVAPPDPAPKPPGSSAPASVTQRRTLPSGFGAIEGIVTDQVGTPMKGIKISARLDERGAVAKVTYTTDEGTFHLSEVPAGTYDVTASAPRLKSVMVRGVEVQGGEAAEVNAVMEVETATEEVKVMERAPVLSTNTAQTRLVYDEEFMDELPVPRAASRAPRQPFGMGPPPAFTRPAPPPGSAAARGGGHDLTFTTAGPATVLAGAPARVVPLGQWRWPVQGERRLVPAVAAETFVVGVLRNPLPYALPGGEARLYVGEDPSGVAVLSPLGPGETAPLPLGTDPAVRHVRHVTARTREQGLVLRDEVTEYTVRVEVANTHGQPIRARVEDLLPRPADDSVSVTLVRTAPQAAVDERTGLVVWKVDLRPGGVARLELTYAVTRRKDRRLVQEELP